MAFELHVWGPAFGLESIDAECLAAITAFRHSLSPRDWCLIADSDTSVSPDNTLPALFHNGTWTSGYRNIISYLRRNYNHKSSLRERLADDNLTPQQEADLLAYSSYLTTRGSALVALSLYASPNAWVELTRPAYSAILPFPLTWTIPTAIRAAAMEKAEHLGMGYLAAESEADEAAAAMSASKPETTSTGFMLLRSKLGPGRSMQPEQTAAIRFQQLADDFFHTLDDLLLRSANNTTLLDTDSPSSLDFLAYGYLALMGVKTPYPIIANCLAANNRPSSRFLEIMRIKPLESPSSHLPIQQPKPRGFLKTVTLFADGAIENMAGLGDTWKRWRHGGIKNSSASGSLHHRKEQDGDEEEGKADSYLSLQTLFAVGGAVTGLAAVGAALFFRSLPAFGAPTHTFESPRDNRGGLHRFGEAGAMLDSLSAFAQPPLSRAAV
ncbi:Tom37 C-terminal domain-containing protein [Xylariaceae sp. FL0594]|nr:Tom37 C-terminal domain-containing protein [Xylariaceae sp. FL0594]